ncbi:GNAT family N-acetyltransferase [Photobacterium japonica]|uniref:GNAT family N-acetyltransferase n=1 Tax=Photobacterium japonica TaxID=2910235 RepID=UPI003D0B0CB9
MKAFRYQIFIKNDSEFALTGQYDALPDALAVIQQRSADEQTCWLYDAHTAEGGHDVFSVDALGVMTPTGHCASPVLNSLALTSLVNLSFSALTPTLSIDNASILINPLQSALPDINGLDGDYAAFSALSQAASQETVMYSPLHRQSEQENDIALTVYHQGELIALATFSRYLEDHRFPTKSSELYYEIALHTLYVKADFRGLGIATALSTLIVNIARKDSEHIYRQVSGLGMNVKLWFSALAITEGGEAVCDILSEAFVEMADDLIDELLDEGYAVRYQEPMIFIDSLF